MSRTRTWGPWLATLALLATGLIAVRLFGEAPRPPAPRDAPLLSHGDDRGRVGPCRLVQVIDGDTLDVSCAEQRQRVRLLRVDTPEREQPGYGAARAALRGLVRGKQLWLQFEERDRPVRGGHGRLLAYVYADERNVNVEIVRAGWSPFWDAYGPGRHEDAFLAAEREARQQARGLWGMRGR